MKDRPKHPRGRPPRLARDVALLLAVEWHRQAERLQTDRAARVVTALWRAEGRKGLGQGDAESRSIYRSIRLAAAELGPGRFMVLPGVEAGGKLVDAAAFFVPTRSSVRSPSHGSTERIVGECWRWQFASEVAEFLPGGAAPPRGSFEPRRTEGSPAQVPVFDEKRPICSYTVAVDEAARR